MCGVPLDCCLYHHHHHQCCWGAYVSPCHGNTTRVWPTTFPLRILRLARDSSSSKCPLHALVGGKAPNLRLWSALYCFASAHFLALVFHRDGLKEQQLTISN